MSEIIEVVEKGIATVSTPNDFKDKALARHTVAIEKLMNGVKKNMVEIAVRLKDIKEKALYEKDGFTDLFDYASKVLGYKKSMVYKMVNVADKFIAEQPNGKGYASIIVHDTEDYSVSQLMELGSLTAEEAIALDENCKIDPSMTAKDIREVVKEYQKKDEPKKDEPKKDEPKEESEQEESEQEEVDGTALAILDVAENLVNILLDDRITKDDKKKIEDFKCWILGIEL